MHLVRWAEVVHPTENGGLDIHSLKNKNKALLPKGYINGKFALYRKIIDAKYGTLPFNVSLDRLPFKIGDGVNISL